ncbi:MAG: ribosomal subunit interface protein [Verrucomicrobiales bacterium]|jgi:putative sigma-54 modulation protein|nr:ribosomal subunit interface protein [Verrucomicrobiales bacterium]|tara:strand:- start:2919 stop:3503 length:585 start_codon:yes stop_codon:yes gene_type:complete
MQVKNINLPITVTGRHVSVTEPMREYAEKKVAGLHLDYPKIIEAKVLLNVEQERHIAEIILFCANHIVIEAHSTTPDMYASIDETISKIARRMRKHKTRMLKSHRPRKRTKEIRQIPEAIFPPEIPEEPEEEHEPVIVHKENYKIKHLFSDEAIMDMEMNEKPFILFHDAKTDKLSIIYRREDGDYGMVAPVEE